MSSFSSPVAKRMRSFSGLKSPAQRVLTPAKAHASLGLVEYQTLSGKEISLETTSTTLATTTTTQQQEGVRKWLPEDFEMGKPLGQGKFGKVYLAKEKGSGVVVAMKVISKACMSVENMHHLRREVEIQSRLHHCNIMKLFGYFHNTYTTFLILGNRYLL
jgi:serine/threonine protein kinase